MIETRLCTVDFVASTSKNLKGTYVKALRDAAAMVRQITQHMSSASTKCEGTQPAQEIGKLKKEIRTLKEENRILEEEWKKERQEALLRKMEMASELLRTKQKVALMTRTQPVVEMNMDNATIKERKTTTNEEPTMKEDRETLIREIIDRVGGMINARLEAFESRLLPEQRCRPPLAHEEKEKRGHKEMDKRDGDLTQNRIKELSTPRATTTGQPLETPWTEVVNRKGQQKKKKASNKDNKDNKEEKEGKEVLKKQVIRGGKSEGEVKATEQQGSRTPYRRDRLNMTIKKGNIPPVAPPLIPKRRKIRPPKTSAVALNMDTGDYHMELDNAEEPQRKTLGNFWQIQEKRCRYRSWA